MHVESNRPVDVLIVDHEPSVQCVLGRLLEREGYFCTFAGDARSARSELTAKDFALMLCDLNLPHDSGLDLIRHASQSAAHTAVVMISGIDSPPRASVAFEQGAYGYIRKPFSTMSSFRSPAPCIAASRSWTRAASGNAWSSWSANVPRPWSTRSRAWRTWSRNCGTHGRKASILSPWLRNAGTTRPLVILNA